MYNMYKKSLKPMNLKSRDWSVLSKKTRCRLCTSSALANLSNHYLLS